MAEPTTYHPDPAWEERVTALTQETYLQECVALLRIGMSWRDALLLEPEERHAVLRVYAAQEEEAFRLAEERAAEKERSRPAPKQAAANE